VGQPKIRIEAIGLCGFNHRVDERTGTCAARVSEKSWRFVGSLRAGRRAAVIIGLIQSACLNDPGPFDYLA